METLYPIFLNLLGKKVLIVGGGRLAVQKLDSLEGSGARLHVVAPRIRLEICQRVRRTNLHPRPYVAGDLTGAVLVFAATDDEPLNRRIVADAEVAGILANAVDDPAHCAFYTPSILRRNGFVMAISSSGRFPGACKALRETLETWLPKEDEALLEELFALRERVTREVTDAAERSAALRELIAQFKRTYLEHPPAREPAAAENAAG